MKYIIEIGMLLKLKASALQKISKKIKNKKTSHRLRILAEDISGTKHIQRTLKTQQ